MKIILAHKFWYRRAGAERYVFDLKEELETAGHEVIPFAMRHPLNEETSWARFFVSEVDFEHPRGLREKWRAFCRMIYSMEAKKKFAALVREVRPDVVHINNIYHHISPSILDVCRRENIPVIHTVHDYKLICPNYKLLCSGQLEHYCKGGRYFREALHRCTRGSLLASLATAIEMTIHHRVFHIYERSVSAWIAPSRAVKDVLVEYGLPAERIHVIHHGVTSDARSGVSSFAPKNGAKRTPASGHNMYLTVLYLGRLASEKGVDIIIRVMKDVPAHLMIVGTGEKKDRLTALVQTLGLQDRVTFKGFVASSERDEILASADLVVVPSVWQEVFGYVVLEAWAHGVPVLASRIGALPELFETMGDECLFTPGDAEELSQKIREIISDAEKRTMLGRRGREIVDRSFGREEMANSTVALYQFILKK